MRFSALRILKESLTGNKNWTPHWRNPSPKSAYDVIIVGVVDMDCPLHIIWHKIME